MRHYWTHWSSLQAWEQAGSVFFAIFWVGWLISKLPPDASLHQHKTLRLFMGMTIAIAVIAFASGVANAWFNAREIAKVEEEKAETVERVNELEVSLGEVRTKSQEKVTELNIALQKARADAQQQVAQYEAAKARNDEIVKSLGIVVNEKQLASLSSNSSEEIKSHIRILQESIKRLESTSGNE